LDIFLVQANTNTCVAHFAPLVCYLGLQTQLPIQTKNVKIPDNTEISEKTSNEEISKDKADQ
jgi:hypothetical protein